MLCVLKWAYKTGIAALSVAVLCASQKISKCMIWAVHKTGSRWYVLCVRHDPESKFCGRLVPGVFDGGHKGMGVTKGVPAMCET